MTYGRAKVTLPRFLERVASAAGMLPNAEADLMRSASVPIWDFSRPDRISGEDQDEIRR